MIRFISDLHLSENEPLITERFLQFMHDKKASTTALYILGDFFETWVGDDNQSDLTHTIQAALRAYHDNGINVCFMVGNRDFLIRDTFCAHAGMTQLNDPHLIHLNGVPTLLTHGDLLCTEDTAYQRFRKVVRLPFLQNFFLALPLFLRKQFAKTLRNISHKKGTSPQAAYHSRYDATESGIQTYLGQWQAAQLIHGHTHRLAIHEHKLDNNQIAKRYVLGDWKPNQGNALCFDGENLFFEYF